MKKTLFAMLLLLTIALSVTIVACSNEVKKVAVTGVSLDETASVVVGSTKQLSAKVLPDNATNKKVTWLSSNTDIAYIDANGLVTAITSGTSIITVTTEDGGFTATCTVTVTPAPVPVEGVKLNKTATDLTVGGTETLTATVSPTDATVLTKVWSSSAESVATVDNSGKVTAIAEGATTITVAVNDVYTATCNVTVTAAPKTWGYASATDRSDVKWVQLWEGGPKWATMNVGSTADDYKNATTYTDQYVGGLYCWGGKNNAKISYIDDHCTDTDYQTSGTDISGTKYDTAKNLWGDKWVMPNKEIFEQLITGLPTQLTTSTDGNLGTNTKWTWCSGESSRQYETGCTLKGWKVSGLPGTIYASNSIFLPLAGYIHYGYLYAIDIQGSFLASTSINENHNYRFSETETLIYVASPTTPSFPGKSSCFNVRAILK